MSRFRVVGHNLFRKLGCYMKGERWKCSIVTSHLRMWTEHACVSMNDDVTDLGQAGAVHVGIIFTILHKPTYIGNKLFSRLKTNVKNEMK